VSLEHYVRNAAMSNRGVFLVFEGMDCSGKSTAVTWAIDKLKELGIEVTNLRIPGGTELGEKLRDILLNGNDINAMAELFLMEATRIEAYHKVIRPALLEGNWVICDRYNASSYAYQGAGKNIKAGVIRKIVENHTPSYDIDCNIYIHRPFDDIMSSMDIKDKDRMESLSPVILKDIYDRYEELFQSFNYNNWYRISNETDIDTYKEEVEDLITELVFEYRKMVNA
jgi:dTMP kinase